MLKVQFEDGHVKVFTDREVFVTPPFPGRFLTWRAGNLYVTYTKRVKRVSTV